MNLRDHVSFALADASVSPPVQSIFANDHSEHQSSLGFELDSVEPCRRCLSGGVVRVSRTELKFRLTRIIQHT